MLTADPDADLEGSLAEWRRYRKRKRLADIHWIDALYRADLTALLGGAAVYMLAGVIGDGPLTARQAADVTAHGSDWMGAVAAVAFAVGLRSGSRGGPLVLERAEVRHVLLAPVDRTTAVRGPVLRQLRFLLFVAVVVGGIVGLLAARRLPHDTAAWMACSALFTASGVALSSGAALCAAAWRLPSWLATALGVGLSALAVADGLGAVEGSPFTIWGHVALWPDGFDPLGLLALAASLALLGIGLGRVGDISVEAAERRSTLVGQLRFAATLQDLRTVIVLRRQLAMELPRLRPWFNWPVRSTRRLPGLPAFPVWRRGWQGVLRWPAARVARMVLLAVAAGLALRGVWEGTTPLLVPAGLALFVAGLDAVEPLAQEVDHPSRTASVPVVRGALHVRHLPVAVVVMALVGVVGAAAGLLVEPSLGGLAVVAVCVPPAALGAVAGAASSVVADPVAAGGGAWALMAPEAAGMRLAVRTMWPPFLAVVGTMPLLAARAAVDHGRSGVGAAAASAVGVLVLFGLVAAWVRGRDRLHARWEARLRAAFPGREGERPGPSPSRRRAEGSTDDASSSG